MTLPDGLPGEARAFLGGFVHRARSVLHEQFVGAYPYGSLAMGDFDPASSDLDVVVAVAGEVSEEAGERLRGLYVEYLGAGEGWARRLEAAFVPVALLRTHVKAVPERHVIMNTATSVFWLGTDVLQWDWILNRQTAWMGNVALLGPSPRTLIDPVDADTIRATVRDELMHSWAGKLDGPEWMKPRKYQAFTVLTMCRALYALDTGEIISKPRAAAWALDSLEGSWHPLIHWAEAHRADPAAGEMTETLAFLRWSVEQASKTPERRGDGR